MTKNPLKDELDRLLNEKLEEYTWKLIRAQKAERIKLCPFCLENITVNNLGRDFCPKKNGNKDLCEQRSIVLNDKKTNQGIDIQKVDSFSVKLDITNDLGKQSDPDQETIDISIRQKHLTRNIRILEILLNTDEIVSFDYDDLKLFRYAFDIYDYKMENEEQLPLYKVGHFAVLIRKDEPCGVTLAKNLEE
jgi:hypothetical protein